MVNAIKKLKALLEVYHREGVGGVLRRVGAHVYERTEFVALQRDLSFPVPEVQCPVAFELKSISADLFEQFKDMPPPFPRHYQYRQEYGQRRCYGSFVNGQVVALMWPLFQEDNERVVSKWRYLLADEARISSIWADPTYRGTGLMAASLERMFAYLKGHHFRYLYAFTWVENFSSIKLHEKLGFRVVSNVYRYSLRWQKDGKGIYIRQSIVRDPIPKVHPGGDLELPERIPEVGKKEQSL